MAGRAGFEYYPLNGDARLSNKKNALLQNAFLGGGEGGIRTRDWFYPALT